MIFPSIHFKQSPILWLFVFYFLVNLPLQAQNDPKAKQILDDLSAKTKAYSSISADFVITTENKKDKTSDTQSGKIIIKGKKYKLEISSQTIICDNKTIWTVLKDAQEIQINNLDEKDKEGSITPNNIFTIYETGFKYEFVKEETLKNGDIHQHVKLFPMDTKKRNFHTAVLTIDKKKKQIVSLKILGKDGMDITYAIKNFQANSEIPDNTFVYNKKSYPGYEEIDLR
jgi:outer membrane lipoprotein carrier protein